MKFIINWIAVNEQGDRIYFEEFTDEGIKLSNNTTIPYQIADFLIHALKMRLCKHNRAIFSVFDMALILYIGREKIRYEFCGNLLFEIGIVRFSGSIPIFEVKYIGTDGQLHSFEVYNIDSLSMFFYFLYKYIEEGFRGKLISSSKKKPEVGSGEEAEETRSEGGGAAELSSVRSELENYLRSKLDSDEVARDFFHIVACLDIVYGSSLDMCKVRHRVKKITNNNKLLTNIDLDHIDHDHIDLDLDHRSLTTNNDLDHRSLTTNIDLDHIDHDHIDLDLDHRSLDHRSLTNNNDHIVVNGKIKKPYVSEYPVQIMNPEQLATYQQDVREVRLQAYSKLLNVDQELLAQLLSPNLELFVAGLALLGAPLETQLRFLSNILQLRCDISGRLLNYILENCSLELQVDHQRFLKDLRRNLAARSTFEKLKYVAENFIPELRTAYQGFVAAFSNIIKQLSNRWNPDEDSHPAKLLEECFEQPSTPCEKEIARRARLVHVKDPLAAPVFIVGNPYCSDFEEKKRAFNKFKDFLNTNYSNLAQQLEKYYDTIKVAVPKFTESIHDTNHFIVGGNFLYFILNLLNYFDESFIFSEEFLKVAKVWFDLFNVNLQGV